MNRFKNSVRTFACFGGLIALYGFVGSSPPDFQTSLLQQDPQQQMPARVNPQGRACQQTVLMLLDGSLKQAPVQVQEDLFGSWADVFAPGVIVLVKDEKDVDYKKPLIYAVVFKDGGESPEGYTSYVDVRFRQRWLQKEIRFKFVYSVDLGLEMRAIDHVWSAVE